MARGTFQANREINDCIRISSIGIKGANKKFPPEIFRNLSQLLKRMQSMSPLITTPISLGISKGNCVFLYVIITIKIWYTTMVCIYLGRVLNLYCHNPAQAVYVVSRMQVNYKYQCVAVGFTFDTISVNVRVIAHAFYWLT